MNLTIGCSVLHGRRLTLRLIRSEGKRLLLLLGHLRQGCLRWIGSLCVPEGRGLDLVDVVLVEQLVLVLVDLLQTHFLRKGYRFLRRRSRFLNSIR